MDTRFLETLVTVVECGSLAEAARRLNLTAAAVAQRIQALEAEIGIALLARSGRTVHPTTAAVAVLGRARAIQREIRDLKSVAASGILSGELRLGVVPSMLTGFLPDVLARFSTSHPQIELRIARGDSAEVYRDLMDERTDVAITSEPPFAIPKTCEWSLLREEPYVVLASATIMGRDPLAILRQEPFIRLHRKLHAGQAIDRYLRKKSICPIERFELDGSRRLRSWWIAVSVSRCSRTMRHPGRRVSYYARYRFRIGRWSAGSDFYGKERRSVSVSFTRLRDKPSGQPAAKTAELNEDEGWGCTAAQKRTFTRRGARSRR